MQLSSQKLFIISDVHGCYEELMKLLTFVPSDATLLFLGDVIDRGNAPLKTLQLVMKLVAEKRALMLLGNHEEMLLNVAENNSPVDAYWRNGGRKTLLEASHGTKLPFHLYPQLLKDASANELAFLHTLPLYAVMDQYLFVHAGVHPDMTDMKQLDQQTALWIRDDFYDHPHRLPYKIFVGHTPIYEISGGTHQYIWIDRTRTKFGLDGGCCFGKQLNGVLLDPSKNYLEIFQTWGSYQYKAPPLIKSKSAGKIYY